jgi:Erv1 / Alr family
MTSRWGPDFWNLFHHISINYPHNPNPIDKLKIRNFLNCIPKILPCSACARHFQKNMLKLPLDENDIKSRNNFLTWFINFHNVVNMSLGKRVVLKNEAQKYIDNLSKASYIENFMKVLAYLESKIQRQLPRSQCKEISNLIDTVLHFSGKKHNINTTFYDHGGFRKIMSEIKKL